jgi:hypothetical protein
VSTPNCTWVGCALGFLTDIRLGCVALTLDNTLAYNPVVPEKELKKLRTLSSGANPIKFTYFEIS